MCRVATLRAQPSFPSSPFKPQCLCITSQNGGPAMSGYSPEQNKTIVLEAFETLFNKRDYQAAERFWSSDYIQHSAHIPPGRDGLFNLVRAAPAALHYDNSLVFAQDDLVMLHGRFSHNGRSHNWVAADILI